MPKPALALVSKQVRDEFLPIWATSTLAVDRIDAGVLDFNFKHLIGVMKRTLRNPSRSLRPVVKLSFTSPNTECVQDLTPWLDYCRTVPRHPFRSCAVYKVRMDRKVWRSSAWLRLRSSVSDHPTMCGRELPIETLAIHTLMVGSDDIIGAIV
jgi:hypothetical protein